MTISGPTTNHIEIRDWADRHSIVPAELFPGRVDHEPAILSLLIGLDAWPRKDLRVITWEEFFLKFDSMGLAFIYDNESTSHHELLQMENDSPYRHPEYRSSAEMNN